MTPPPEALEKAREIVSIWGFPSSDWKSGHPGLISSIATHLDAARERAVEECAKECEWVSPLGTGQQVRRACTDAIRALARADGATREEKP